MQRSAPKEHPLILRRVGMIHAFLTAAKQLVHPVQVAIDGYRDPGKDAEGRPLSVPYVVQRVMGMGELDRAAVISSSCVAGVNLGYAYEHTLKLLNLVSTGKNSGELRGSERHKLSKLYEQLPQSLQRDLSSIHKRILTHDIELEEDFGMEKPPSKEPPMPSPVPLLEQLKYWDRNEIFRGGRYKYIDATARPRARIRICIPFRAVQLLDGILAEVLFPKLGLKYTPRAPLHR